MSARQKVQDATGVVLTGENNLPLLAFGATVPTDATAGYEKGCLFIDSDATTINTMLYVNIGTTASCNFDPLKG